MWDGTWTRSQITKVEIGPGRRRKKRRGNEETLVAHENLESPRDLGAEDLPPSKSLQTVLH